MICEQESFLCYHPRRNGVFILFKSGEPVTETPFVVGYFYGSEPVPEKARYDGKTIAPAFALEYFAEVPT